MQPMDRGDLPGRGDTFYVPGETPDTTQTNGLYLALRGYGKEGALEWFPDVNPRGSGAYRSGDYVLMRLMRNMSGITLYASQLAHVKQGSFNAQVDGLGAVTNQADCIPIDEYLSTTGVMNYDCFWGVVQGPAVILTSAVGSAANVIAVGAMLVALTAASSGATDAGHVASGTSLTDNLLNVIGEAMSAASTAQTLYGLLVFVNRLKG